MGERDHGWGASTSGPRNAGLITARRRGFRFLTSDSDSDGRGSTLPLSRSNGTSVEYALPSWPATPQTWVPLAQFRGRQRRRPAGDLAEVGREQNPLNSRAERISGPRATRPDSGADIAEWMSGKRVSKNRIGAGAMRGMRHFVSNWDGVSKLIISTSNAHGVVANYLNKLDI